MTNGVITGFVVEADERGFYYGRTGEWLRYLTPARAYVWTEEEVSAIKHASEASKNPWPLSPAFVHAAIYDSETGATIITAPAVAISDLKLRHKAGVTVPQSGGLPHNIQATLGRLNAAQMIASDMSL